MRITVSEDQVTTFIQDGSDGIHRQCNDQIKLNKAWIKHHFALVAKNSESDTRTQLITDVEINSISLATLDPVEGYPTQEQIQSEKNNFLLKRHSINGIEGEDFDVSRIFELNLASELATEQKKTLHFIDNDDEVDDLLYKHHIMLARVQFNFIKLNAQLEMEIASEENFERNRMSQQGVVSAH